jgi:hypothetical protein
MYQDCYVTIKVHKQYSAPRDTSDCVLDVSQIGWRTLAAHLPTEDTAAF